MKGCALGLILKVRVFVTRKWPIALLWAGSDYYFQHSYFLHWVTCGQGDTKLDRSGVNHYSESSEKKTKTKTKREEKNFYSLGVEKRSF